MLGLLFRLYQYDTFQISPSSDRNLENLKPHPIFLYKRKEKKEDTKWSNPSLTVYEAESLVRTSRALRGGVHNASGTGANLLNKGENT